jgi:hypothetical protein
MRTSSQPIHEPLLAESKRSGLAFHSHAAHRTPDAAAKRVTDLGDCRVARMTVPAWLPMGLAAAMLLIAAGCAARLAICRARGRTTELEADALHVLMGVAMAGMLEPRLSPVPAAAWRVVFAAAAAWFSWRAISARGRARSRKWRCAHPAPHAVECAAMTYMLLPARVAGRATAMAMPGMTGTGAAVNPALALVLALFMAGYVLWTSDQLAALSRARAGASDPGTESTGTSAAIPDDLAPARALTSRRGARGGGVTPPLAPRFAACYKIAMSIAMGYMLITMV